MSVFPTRTVAVSSESEVTLTINGLNMIACQREMTNKDRSSIENGVHAAWQLLTKESRTAFPDFEALASACTPSGARDLIEAVSELFTDGLGKPRTAKAGTKKPPSS